MTRSQNFDKTTKDNNLDLDYLKQLYEKRADRKMGSAFPPEDSDSKAIRTRALQCDSVRDSKKSPKRAEILRYPTKKKMTR